MSHVQHVDLTSILQRVARDTASGPYVWDFTRVGTREKYSTCVDGVVVMAVVVVGAVNRVVTPT